MGSGSCKAGTVTTTLCTSQVWLLMTLQIPQSVTPAAFSVRFLFIAGSGCWKRSLLCFVCPGNVSPVCGRQENESGRRDTFPGERSAELALLLNNTKQTLNTASLSHDHGPLYSKVHQLPIKFRITRAPAMLASISMMLKYMQNIVTTRLLCSNPDQLTTNAVRLVVVVLSGKCVSYLTPL